MKRSFTTLLVISMAVGTVSPGISCSPGKVPHHPRPPNELPQRHHHLRSPHAQGLHILSHRGAVGVATAFTWSQVLSPAAKLLQAPGLTPSMGTGQASSTPFKRDPSTGHRIPRGLWRAASTPSSSPAQTLDTNYLYKCCQSIFSKCPSFYLQPGPLSRTPKGLTISTAVWSDKHLKANMFRRKLLTSPSPSQEWAPSAGTFPISFNSKPVFKLLGLRTKLLHFLSLPTSNLLANP